jgi:hypothetical protein
MPTVFILDDTDRTPTMPNSNKLFTHPHVEDYIEIIAGYREPNGKSKHSIFSVGEPAINLARYDMKIVPSLAEQTLGQNKGYTDKQARLAADLVLKYERQLYKLGVDIAPVRTPEYRLPTRQIDRSTRVWIENDTVKLKFPYSNELINTVRTASKESKGQFRYNRETRVYEAELTEWNLNWIYSFALQNNFEIDHSIKQLMDLVLLTEKTEYKIELQYAESALTIINAETSLLDYVKQYSGELCLENILTLCDLAPVLGYSVHKDIEVDVIRNFNTRFWSLCANRHLKVDPSTSQDLVKELVNYAELTNRWPIFVYEPDLSGRLLELFGRHIDSQHVVVLNNKNVAITDDAKLVYTNKIPRMAIDRIPLMVSSAGMLYGGDRQIWLQAAEKVVYFSNDVYNKNINKGKEVCKLG